MSSRLSASVRALGERSPRLQHTLGYGIPIILGGTIGLTSGVHILTQGESSFTQVIVGLVGVALAGPLILGGLWLATRPRGPIRADADTRDTEYKWWRDAAEPGQEAAVRPTARVGAWCLAGALPVAVLAGLAALYELAHGVALADPWLLVVWGGGAGGIGGFTTGIYDSRRAHEHTQYEQVAERLTTLVETVPIALIALDSDGRVEAWNQAAETIFGYQKSEVIGESFPVIPREKQSDFDDLLQQAESGRTIHDQEFEWQRHDGSRVNVRFWAAPLTDHPTQDTTATGEHGDGSVHAIVAVEDISDQKDREQELELLHRAIDRAPIGVTITDPSQEDNPIISVNEGFQELTGYSEAEILGQNCRFLQGKNMDPEPVAAMREAIDAQEPVTVELRNYRKDGTEFWNQVTIAPVRDETGSVTHFVGFQQDITDRKEYEQELELYQRAVEEAGHVVMITDRDGTIEYVNQAFEETTGYAKEEVRGENPRILQSGKHSDAFYEDLWETILAGEVWEAELINQRKDGSLYQIDQTIAPITNSDGTITHFVGIEYDITERRLREQRLDVLNRILRHNVRNAMNVVRGHASSLVEMLADAELQSQAATIKDRADELIALSEQAATVRDLFQRDPDVDSVCDVGELVSGLTKEFKEEYSDAQITVTTPDSVHVQTDDQIAMAIREAVDNAVAHSDQDPPEVTITVTPSEATEAGEWVEIVIADNGPGIPEDEQTVIEVGEETPLLHGAGIGLWLIYWVVVSFGGDVTISENNPRGSIVTLRLPAATT